MDAIGEMVPAGRPVALDFEVAWLAPDGRTRAALADAVDVAFEGVAPVRTFPAYRGQQHFPGWYWAASTDQHIGYESWLERDHALLLDFDPAVAAFAAQPFWLSWRDGSSGRTRSHTPDFFARLVDGSALVVDCRPQERIDERSAASFAATRLACQAVGWSYRLVGAIEAVRAANLRWLAGYRHPRHGEGGGLVAAVAAAFAVPAPLFAQAATVGDPIVVLPVVFHLLWRGVLGADLSLPLADQSVVSGGWARL
jgi:hypothetical protein